jgi:hypothetical protein
MALLRSQKAREVNLEAIIASKSQLNTREGAELPGDHPLGHPDCD